MNYIQNAIQTESQIDDRMRDRLLQKRTIRLLHSILGLVSECEELDLAIKADDSVNLVEEIGDIFWYSAIGLDEIGAEFFDEISEDLACFNTPQDEMTKIVLTASKLSDMVKKWIFYGQEMNLDDIENGILNIVLCASAIGKEFGYNYLDIQRRNIAKLKARYPKKFESEKAINRDLQQELFALNG